MPFLGFPRHSKWFQFLSLTNLTKNLIAKYRLVAE